MKHYHIFQQYILSITRTSLIMGIILFGCEKETDNNIDPNDNKDNPEDTIPSCWTKLENMLSSRSTHMMSACDYKIYVAGDRSGGSSCETYDQETGNWKALSRMSEGREFVDGCAYNGKIYVMGGSRLSKYHFSMEEYDPETDQWTKKSPMPTPRYGHATVALDDKIYVIGGATDWPVSEQYTTIEVYDPATDNWTTLSSHTKHGFINRWALSACIVNGKIYAIGGIQADYYPAYGDFYSAVAIVQEYDPGSDTWTVKSAMPTPRFGLAVVSVNNLIYAIGGLEGLGEGTNLYDVVEVYNPESDSWMTKTPMPKGLVNLAACAVGNRIYVSGGEDLHKTPSSNVFMYSPESDSIAQ